MFSERTHWHRQPNRLANLLDERKASGRQIFDLTESNPTACGFSFGDILSPLTNPKILEYHPDSCGMLSARQAIVKYYADQSADIDPDNIFLTSSTSEAYSLIFKLVCNAGDSIAVPVPSYPLFEYLSQINDVALTPYRLQYDHGWRIDLDSLKRSLGPETRAIVLVHPHNPTGMFLKRQEFNEVAAIARERSLPLIVDEVFIDYAFEADCERMPTTVGSGEALTYTLNGISKMIGLPQMKLGWIALSGTATLVAEARERLEILCDTFLSVNTPVQLALPHYLTLRGAVQHQILTRVQSNLSLLTKLLNDHDPGNKPPCSLLIPEGGWYAIIRVPRTKSDEAWAVEMLERVGVYVFPGYYFDLEEEGFLLVSLLPEEALFKSGCEKLIGVLSSPA